MGTIVKRGPRNYQARLRIDGSEISKTFTHEEDAQLYIDYKERLHTKMKNFEIPIKDMVTLNQIFELKLKSVPLNDRRTISDIKLCQTRFTSIFHGIRFYSDITFEDWIKSAETLYSEDVFKGAKTENGRRKMSPVTLKKIFAYASASVSYAQSQGIEVENHPLRVIQCYITPLIDKSKTD